MKGEVETYKVSNKKDRVGTYKHDYCGSTGVLRLAHYNIIKIQYSQHMYNKRNETDHDESLNERLDLLNRLNAMMEEIRTYKEENESLAYEVENKDRSLRESNETVTILSLRINYMITQKFLNMIEKVYESIEYRHLNDAFDALIDEANENFEREEVAMFG